MAVSRVETTVSRAMTSCVRAERLCLSTSDVLAPANSAAARPVSSFGAGSRRTSRSGTVGQPRLPSQIEFPTEYLAIPLKLQRPSPRKESSAMFQTQCHARHDRSNPKRHRPSRSRQGHLSEPRRPASHQPRIPNIVPPRTPPESPLKPRLVPSVQRHRHEVKASHANSFGPVLDDRVG